MSTPTLKRSKAVVAEKAAVKKSDTPSFDVKGTVIGDYNAAIADQKAAEAKVAELKPDVLKLGLTHLFQTNVENPSNPVSSIKLVDEAGATCRVTGQDRYSAVDPDVTVQMFADIAVTRGITPNSPSTLQIDPNKYVQEVVKPAFNTAALYDADGNFSDANFNAYQKAITAVTRDLVARGKLPAGTDSPLTGKRLFQPKPGFHALRWSDFPRVTEQTAITKVLTNTITVTPLAPAAE